MVYLLIFEKCESSSCRRKIPGREVTLEMVSSSGNQYRWIYKFNFRYTELGVS